MKNSSKAKTDQVSQCSNPVSITDNSDGFTASHLTPCAWRTQEAGSHDAVHLCLNPRVRVEGRLVSPGICGVCSFWQEGNQPHRQPAPIQNSMIRPKIDLRANNVSTWAVGITTAPRTISTLSQCIQSLRLAGWTELRLFAEPNSKLPAKQTGLLLSLRDRPMGAFPNWMMGLSELVLRNPHADAYFMAQDDAIFTGGLRAYLENTLWPDRHVGVISVYCPSHYSQGQPPGFHDFNNGWQAWGALGYIFPNASARNLLGTSRIWEHRRSGPSRGLKNIDSVVGLWCQQAKLTYHVHIPSLAQHIGETSTLYPEATAMGRRRAIDFVDHVHDLRNAARPISVALGPNP